MRNLKGAGLLPFLLAMAIVGCQTVKVAPPVTSAEDRVAPVVTAKKILAVYEGILPCGDCQGIRTELTLFDEDFTYRLVESYLRKDGERTVESEGTWILLRPTIYRLRPAGPGTVRDFQIVDGRQIQELKGLANDAKNTGLRRP